MVKYGYIIQHLLVYGRVSINLILGDFRDKLNKYILGKTAIGCQGLKVSNKITLTMLT